jgi:pyruvate dehydrogenase E1 component
LRTFFEIDRHYIALTALKALAEEDSMPTTVISEAIERYQIDTEKRNPIGA